MKKAFDPLLLGVAWDARFQGGMAVVDQPGEQRAISRKSPPSHLIEFGHTPDLI
jgi:hypothetical protein